MNKILVKGTQIFLGKEIPVIEGGFGENQKVMLVKTVAEIHRVALGDLNKLINNNINEFEFGIDIIDLKTGDYQSSVLENNFVVIAKNSGLFTKAQWGNKKQYKQIYKH